MKLRIGFIGLGAIGLSHAKAINRLCGDKAEITALCGTSDANFQAATEVAPSAKRFKEPAEVVTVESGN